MLLLRSKPISFKSESYTYNSNQNLGLENVTAFAQPYNHSGCVIKFVTAADKSLHDLAFPIPLGIVHSTKGTLNPFYCFIERNGI